MNSAAHTAPNNGSGAFRAAFFDRDHTLVYGDPALGRRRRELIQDWAGKAHVQPEDLFERALGPRPEGKGFTLEEEIAFWKRYWRMLLTAQGIRQDLEERTETLFRLSFCKGLLVYEDVQDTLRWFRERGFRMGVISDTFPSLELTLEAAGLGAYFDCCICSDQVGVMKPDRRIYQAALDALGVTAGESLYVDDYEPEADGARLMGMTAFHIVRNGEVKSRWDIRSLTDMTVFVQNHLDDCKRAGKPL